MSRKTPLVFSLCCLLAMAAPNCGISKLFAQYIPPVPGTDPLTQQRVDRLYQRDEILRTSIQGQRIDRQAEISRLEGRIAKLERAADHPSQNFDSFRFLQLLMTLEENADQPAQVEVASEGESGPSTMPPQPLEQPTQDALSPSRTKRVLQFIADDYMAALNTQILEARIMLREESSQLMSLQRLASKGLATSAQVELQQLKNQHAEARFLRLRQQQTGLISLFPNYFPDKLPPPSGDLRGDASEEESPSRNDSIDPQSAAQAGLNDADGPK